MKVLLNKDTDIRNLEEKTNEELRELKATGNDIVDVKYTAVVLPETRGDKVVSYKALYSVMILYCPRHGEGKV